MALSLGLLACGGGNAKTQESNDAARKLAEEGLRPDVIIVDPPRKGCDHTVLDSITSTMVHRMQMLARPTPFCFMRYIIPDTQMKWLG